MSTDTEKIASARNMIGKWNKKNENTDVTIEISKETIVISGNINNETINVSFNNSSWWVGDFLFFTSNPSFYLQYATEEHLGFGELVIPGIAGERKWGFKFDRVE